MRYNTIVEKSDDGLVEIIRAVEQFEEDRFLAGLELRRYTAYDVQQMAMTVREYQAKMNREVLALGKFSETFIQEYATDHNKCFETAERLFNRIRTTIGASRKVFRKTCPIVRRQVPAVADVSIFRRSMLAFASCERNAFGVTTYDDSVRMLYEDLKTFFTTVIQALLLCRSMIRAELEVRQDEAQCLAIYRGCREKVLAGVRDLAKTMEVMLVPDSELDRRRRAAKSLAGYAQEHYHRVDTSEFRTAIVVEAVRQGRNRGLTDDEARLWPDDHEKALRVRGIISRFDELPGAKGQKGRLDSGLLVEFIKWCGVKKDMEKNLYETYFCATYSGQFKLPAWNTVYKARKEREESGITDEEERRAFEKILVA